MMHVPRLPLGFVMMNKVGALLRRAGLPLARLDESSLLEKARRRTGLSDFGDERFREPLGRLLDSLEHEAGLSFMGRVIAERDILRLLENRLRVSAVVQAHPEIGSEMVAAPIFIVGLPRTGTSILHELMAQDPQNRTPMTWEMMYPWPPPERATYESDPRIAKVAKQLAGVDRLVPGFQSMHRMGADLPQECAALTALDFMTMIFHTSNRVPGYQAWLERADMRGVYAAHRQLLQYLQWRCPGERWVLKSPQHLWSLDALLAVYPDARIVQTHRDPLKVIASLTSLISTLRSMSSDHTDPAEIAVDWTKRLAEGLQGTIDVRNRLTLSAGQLYDLQFEDFVRDEIGSIGRIYRHFGLELSDAAAARMRTFLTRHPSDKHGAHRYAFSDTGLDEAVERQRYRGYQERFGVPSEPVL